MIVIVNYGMGNLGSVSNMLKRNGAQAIVSSKIQDIERADKLILPGVGAFNNGMKNINELGLLSVLNHKVVDNKTPILGICLGMQLFAKKSEEGDSPGLGWLDAETIKFNFNNISQNNMKIPHMGWNSVKICKESPLFKDMYEDARFYFVHSYYVICHNDEDVLTKTHYGYDFVSSVERGNIAGTQFHPEKSHKYGMKILKNFVEYF